MHLHEVLNMSIQDYELERKRIETLFEQTPIDIEYEGRYGSLKDFLGRNFVNGRLIGTAISIDDFIMSFKKYWVDKTLEGLLFYSELVVNILIEQEQKIKHEDPAVEISNQIVRNIKIILERTGHELRSTADKFVEIVQKNALSSTSIMDVGDADAALAVLDYNHFQIKGDITKKRELLVSIGRYVEPLIEDSELKRSHYSLVDDVKFCLNNLHIRHNNEVGRHAKEFMEKMPDEELERWYDKAYLSMLLLIEEHKQLETHKEIDALKKNFKK